LFYLGGGERERREGGGVWCEKWEETMGFMTTVKVHTTINKERKKRKKYLDRQVGARHAVRRRGRCRLRRCRQIHSQARGEVAQRAGVLVSHRARAVELDGVVKHNLKVLHALVQ
jgi:hypothetical protein